MFIRLWKQKPSSSRIFSFLDELVSRCMFSRASKSERGFSFQERLWMVQALVVVRHKPLLKRHFLLTPFIYSPTTALVLVGRNERRRKGGKYVVQVQSPTFSTLSLKNVNHDGPHDAILLLRSAPSILENMMASNSITTCTYFTAHWTSRCTIVTKPCSLRTLDVYSFIAFMVHLSICVYGLPSHYLHSITLRLFVIVTVGAILYANS